MVISKELTENHFMTMLRKQIKTEADKIIAEECEGVAERVKVRMGRISDTVALSILSDYDIMADQRQLVIRVRKGEDK